MVTVQVSRSPTFQALSGASAPGAGPRIVPKYLTRSWEDVSRPWKCLGSRRLRRGERLRRMRLQSILVWFPVFVLVSGCSVVEPFVVNILASNSTGPVIRPAVDRIEILIDPAENVRFDAISPTEYDDGVEASVTSAGEFRLRLARSWIDENWLENGSTFRVEVPLYHDGDVPDVPNPLMRVNFLRAPRGGGSEEVIADTQQGRNIDWPLEPGGEVSVQVQCRLGFELQCQNTDPPAM